MKFSIKDFFSKCDQIRGFRRIQCFNSFNLSCRTNEKPLSFILVLLFVSCYLIYHYYFVSLFREEEEQSYKETYAWCQICQVSKN